MEYLHLRAHQGLHLGPGFILIDADRDARGGCAMLRAGLQAGAVPLTFPCAGCARYSRIDAAESGEVAFTQRHDYQY